MSQDVSQDELRQRVRRYLEAHSVLTLATAGPQGPWAAAVFYAGDEHGLVFLSSPSTRHASELARQPRVAATVQDDTADWAAIKGVQLEGTATELQSDERDEAQRLYARKFPLVAGGPGAPAAIAQALAKVRWYRLRPERLFFVDNSLGFGHRDELLLPGPSRSG